MILGLSDHTPGHETVLGAVALGAELLKSISQMIHLGLDLTTIFNGRKNLEGNGSCTSF